MSPRRLAFGLLAIAATLSVVSLLTRLRAGTPAGFWLEVTTPCLSDRPAPPDAVGRIHADDLPRESLASGCAHARWTTFWVPRASGTYVLKVVADGPLTVRIDGQLVVDGALAAQKVKRKARVDLDAGAHAVAIDWSPAPDRRQLRVAFRRPGDEWQPLDRGSVFAERPSHEALLLAGVRATLGWLTPLAWLLCACLWIVLGWPRLRALAARVGAGARYLGSGWRRQALTAAALAAILLYGSALRLEALADGYWPGAPPRWMQRAVDIVRPWRPMTLRWSHVGEHPYAGGDPSAYLRYARQMRNPYEPRVREPMFVIATKAGLALTHNRDVGVSVASAVFSILLLAAIYLLGAESFSRPVGLLAAAALAIEREAIANSVTGYRDEAFAFFVALAAWAALRLYRRGSFVDALILGLVGGFAWLTRITTPTLLAPLYLALCVFPRTRPWRQRLGRVGVAALISCALIAPFMINCAVAYGDPFYSINEHVVFYRVNANLTYTRGMTVLEYLRSSFRPAQMADTFFVGYTEYPFGRKWSYGDWSPWLGPLLARLAIAGLALWIFSRTGRLLWLVHLATMFAFAFTYEAREGGPWRLTLHAYPFYLLAAGMVCVGILELATSRQARQALRERLTPRRSVAAAALLCALAAAGWGLWHGLHYLRFAETVRAGHDPTRLPGVVAGERDAFFFAGDWYPARPAPGWPGHFLRYPRGRVGTLRLPLTRGRDYTIVLGLDPLAADPAQSRQLDVALNGQHLTSLSLAYTPQRLGRHTINVPAALVADGVNHVRLAADADTRVSALAPARRGQLPGHWETAFELSYVLVRTEGPTDPAGTTESRPASSSPARQ